MGASYHKANFIIMKEKNSKRLHSDVQDSHLFPSFFFAFLPDACHHKMFGCLSVWRFLLFFAQQSSCSRERYSFLPLGQALLSQFISSYLSALTFMSSHGIFFCVPLLLLFVSKFPLLKRYNSYCLSDHSRGFILIVLSPNAVTFYDTGI